MSEKSYTPIAIDGKLYIRGDFMDYVLPEYNEVFSIISSNFKDEVIIKLNSNEIVNVNLILAKKTRAEIPYRGISMQTYIMVKFDEKILKLSLDDYDFVVTTKIMQNIKDATTTCDPEYPLRLKFKDNRIDDFKVVVDDNLIVSKSGEMHDIKFDPNYEHYCTYGKMREISIKKHYFIADLMMVLNTVDDENFVFYCVHNNISKIKLLIHDESNTIMVIINDHHVSTKCARIDSAISNPLKYVYMLNTPMKFPYAIDSDKFIDVPNVVSLSQTKNKLQITTKSGEIINLTNRDATNAPHINRVTLSVDLIKYSRPAYYVDSSRNVVKISQLSFIEYENKYYDTFCLEPLKILPDKFPIPSVQIVETDLIRKYQNNITINHSYVILDKIMTQIADITIDYNFTPFDIVITMKDGVTRRCALVASDDIYLVFEDGEVLALVPKNGELYSSGGIYTMLAPSEYERINRNLYNIRGNIVMFECMGELSNIYESFGNFICHGGTYSVGEIIINRRQISTKASAT